MQFLEALEEFSNNLPDVVEDLKDLDGEFMQLVSEIAQEGTELFTIGFQEMVVNDNNEWQTSFENNVQAQQLIDESESNYPNKGDSLVTCRNEAFSLLEQIEQARNRCVDQLHLIYRPCK